MGPLEGVKVVEVGQVLAGPTASLLLADYGADVVKVEPLEGELWRRLPSVPPDSPLKAAGMSGSFLTLNGNKRSISLDLATPSGKDIFLRLAKWADALIENMRPGGMERLGLGYESLQAINPRLVYLSISAFGHRGPDAGKPGNDNCALGRAGVLASRRYADGTPVTPGVFVSDMATGILSAFAVTAALLERKSSGVGQKVETSLLAAALTMSIPQMLKVGDDVRSLKPRADPMSMLYKCQDELYLVVTFMTEAHWRGLCDALGLPHLVHDPDFSNASVRAKNAVALVAILETAFAARPRNEWLVALDQAGVPNSPVLEREQVFDEAQVKANGLLVERCHPVVGRISVTGLPVSFSRTPGHLCRDAPGLGEHTREVLYELGYSPVEVQHLLEESVARAANEPCGQ